MNLTFPEITTWVLVHTCTCPFWIPNLATIHLRTLLKIHSLKPLFRVAFILENTLKLRDSKIMSLFSPDVHHLINKSFSRGLAINAEHLHLLLQGVYALNMNETYRSSGVSTWNVLSITVVHWRHLMINVFGLGRSVFISWHSTTIKEERVMVHTQV